MGESSFLSQFLMITDIKTVIFIGVLLLTFGIVKQFEKKKVKFSTRTIYATLIGLALGVVIQLVAGLPEDPSQVVWLQEVSKWFGLFGYGFMDLLKMLVVPIVFLSIVRVIMNLKGSENIGKLTFRSVGMLLGTTAIAAIVGVVMGNLFKLGVSDTVISSSAEKLQEITPVVDTLRNLLPSNPVKAMAEANIVAIVAFATFIGLAIKRLNNKHAEVIKPFVDLVEAFYKIIISVSITVIKFMPYAVVALMANAIVGHGVSAILDVIDFIVALYVSIFVMFIVHLIIITLSGVNPITPLKRCIKSLSISLYFKIKCGYITCYS